MVKANCFKLWKLTFDGNILQQGQFLKAQRESG